MSDPTNKTERDQIDVLIQQKKDEISRLEDLKKEYSDDSDTAELRTPAEVAADPNASSEERAAAANATLGQEPAQVNAEQSYPTPSTHDEAKEENERRYAALHENLNDKAQEEFKDTSAEEHAHDNEAQGVELPDGRENVNDLGAKGQVEDAGVGPVEGESTQQAENEANAAKEKQAETNKNKSDVATKGKTDDKSKSKSSKKDESKDK